MFVAVSPLVPSTLRAIPKLSQRDSPLTLIVETRQHDVGGLHAAVQYETMTQQASNAPAAWQFFQQMLADVTKVVTEDAESERELLEGLRVIARVSSLCSQMSVESDLGRPVFFDMCSENRMIGGPNPDGNYFLAMIRGDRRYRITGTRGTSAYLGFQILAGTGLTPRRMSNYVSDVDLALNDDEFALVLSAQEPDDLGGAQWVQIPDDASSVVVREYIGDRAAEQLATLRIEALDPDPSRR